MGKEVLVARKKEASTRPRVYVNVGWLLCKPRLVFAYTYTRTVRRCWNRIARGERARLCGGRLCATYAVCCNLYSARLQFYLLHVFVANRAHTVYVKPRCWHVHATFPFQNRFWRRAPRRLSQRRRRFSRQGCIYSNVRHSSSSNLYTFFFFFIYIILFRVLGSNISNVASIELSSMLRSIVLDFIIIVNRCVPLIILKIYRIRLCYFSIFHRRK